MSQTIKKVALGLIELLRIVKAHGIECCTLVGFALPKLGTKGFVAKVEATYDPDSMAFIIRYQTLSKSGESFPALLVKATEHNCQQLLECQSSTISEMAKEFE